MSDEPLTDEEQAEPIPSPQAGDAWPQISPSERRRCKEQKEEIKAFIVRLARSVEGGVTFTTIKHFVFREFPYALQLSKMTRDKYMATVDLHEIALKALLDHHVLVEERRHTGGQVPVCFYKPNPAYYPAPRKGVTTMPKSKGYDEDQYAAEDQVRQALMDTPVAKAEVKRVKSEIKAQKAETKRRFSGKGKKKSPRSRGIRNVKA